MLFADLLPRWKKQIFTEAEMVAQAEEPTPAKAESATDSISGEPSELTAGQPVGKEPQQASTQAIAPDTKSPGAPSSDEGSYAVDRDGESPATYADAVKHHEREATIPEEHEPSSPKTVRDSNVTPEKPDGDGTSAVLDKGKGRSRDASAPATPSDSPKPTQEADQAVEQLLTPSRPSATPTKSRPTSFPVMPRLTSSNSQRSIHSTPSGATTPSRSTSYPNLAKSTSNSSHGHGQHGTPPDEQRGGKARKRLNSIKGFVRRISDQGGGLVRSNSTGRPGSRSGGLVSPETQGADEGNKKRMSMNRGKSTQG